jgi:phosphatidylglycerophosphate synthase
VPGEFFLVPCDRVFDPKMIRRLLEEPLEGMTLAATRESAVGREGRTLRMQDRCVVSALTGERDSDAVWTGIATVGRPALGAMEELRDLGGPLTLARLVDVLAREGTVRIADVDKAYWQDLYTDGGRTEAKRQLLGALRKSVDGVIARHINRRFSLAMTALLMHTPVRPNHVTAFSLLVSFAAALTAAYATQASAWWLIVGALLWQLSSMLDGIDGELARLKFAESKMGEWFDTLTDDIGKFVFFLGAGYGASVVTGQSVWLQLCVVGVAVQFTLSLNLYRKLLKTGSGSHYALSWETKPKNTWASRLYHRIEFMSRRDYYVLIWLFLTVIGFVQAGIILMFATTSVVLVHEVLRPRQIRENFALRPPAG